MKNHYRLMLELQVCNWSNARQAVPSADPNGVLDTCAGIYFGSRQLFATANFRQGRGLRTTGPNGQSFPPAS